MYAGLSLFIIVGPYLYLVICVVYAYNFAWGGLKNGKNGGEPNGFCLIFVVSNLEILGNLRKGVVDFFREIFFHQFRHIYSQSISDRFSAHVRPVLRVIFSHAFSNTCTI